MYRAAAQMNSPWLTVLMPAYNEEAGLSRSISLVASRLKELQVPSEILIVDDCSSDRTGRIADELTGHYLPDETITLRVFHQASNQGIGGGLRTGIAEALGEWLILIPADLALDLADLSKYFDSASVADIVVGIASHRKDYNAWRRLVSFANAESVRILFRMKQRQFQYICMYRLAVLRSMDIEYWRSAFFHAEILIKARDRGYRLVEVEVRYLPRSSGTPTGANWQLIAKTSRDMLRYWTRWITRRDFVAPGGLVSHAEPPESSPRRLDHDRTH
jgi:glycosyltransferase involved in cell wall biosynthesis